MQTTQTRRPVETLAETWHRLARLAVEQGVTLLTEGGSGERFACSVSRPGEIHRLTPNGSGFTCSCEGYLRWQRCKHAAALLAELGWLPQVEPIPAAVDARPAACPTCHGAGWVKATTGGRLTDWVGVPCRDCSGHRAA